MKNYVMGFDIGTGSSKAVLADLEGNIAAEYSQNHKIEVLHPGWQEESMQMWWEEFKAAVRKFFDEGIKAEEIKAISVTGLIPALCPIDAEGNILRKAILHTDVRAEEELEFIHKELDKNISHGHMLPKILWLKDHEPDIYEKTDKVMVPHGFLAYRLTGKVSIDYDAASMIGGVFSEETLDWEKDKLEKIGIRNDILPHPVPATCVLGNIAESAAEETGLSCTTKVVAGVGDTFASILGGGAYNAGHLMIYLGTSVTVLYAETSPKNYTSVPHYGQGKSHFVGKIASFGESTMHLRSCLGYDAWDELNKGLPEIPAGSEGLWYLPHYKLQTEKTWFGSDAEYMLGFRGKHTKFHIYHAMLEGIAFNVKYNINQVDYPVRQINIFGGGANSLEILQIFADILGKELNYNPKSSTALGAAFLAGYGSGYIKDYSVLGDVWFGDSRKVLPCRERSQIYESLYKRYEELRNSIMEIDRKYAQED